MTAFPSDWEACRMSVRGSKADMMHVVFNVAF
jgi:hypothetical protein